jgi:uncharacterized hydrophobic protein (TIGR00271 family)
VTRETSIPRVVITTINKLLNNFRLFEEKEQYENVVETIDKGVAFRGTNLWILVFAIVVCSLGLNVNSTAVIIGAMLISPLMGPIMGLGLGAAINDLALIRKSYFNFFFAVGVSLLASTVYFLITPLNDAHSELLARTTPSFYDVLIAFFGGLAGILATSSKLKGNVIPGVAIATALMPPLCTAGYGLATLQMNFFLGALYLFFINSVFIAFATLLTVRYLNFPQISMLDKMAERRAKRIITGLIVFTMLPSVYFAWDLVIQDRFEKNAQLFIERECQFPNAYIIEKQIEPKKKEIALTLVGEPVSEEAIDLLRSRLNFYLHPSTTLHIRQGFAILKEKSEDTRLSQLSLTLLQKEKEIEDMREELDQLREDREIGFQIYRELAVYFPELQEVLLAPNMQVFRQEGESDKRTVAVLSFKEAISAEKKGQVRQWLRTRFNDPDLTLLVREEE